MWIQFNRFNLLERCEGVVMQLDKKRMNLSVFVSKQTEIKRKIYFLGIIPYNFAKRA